MPSRADCAEVLPADPHTDTSHLSAELRFKGVQMYKHHLAGLKVVSTVEPYCAHSDNFHPCQLAKNLSTSELAIRVLRANTLVLAPTHHYSRRRVGQARQALEPRSRPAETSPTDPVHVLYH